MPGGTGVVASAALDGSGTAFEATATALFDATIRAARSGLVSITYPSKSATVAVPGGLTTSSLVFATLQSGISGIDVMSAGCAQ
jgi:hypothetical protein